MWSILYKRYVYGLSFSYGMYVEDGGGWSVLLQQCHPNSAGSLVIAVRTE